MGVKVRLSDEAFNSLLNSARELKYARLNNWSYGLSRYIEELSILRYVDNRPDYLKEWKPEGHNIWFVPEYTNYTVERMLGISRDAQYSFTMIALAFDILRLNIRYLPDNETQPFVVHFKRKQTPLMLTSAVLEAIGTNLLLPRTLPPIAMWSKLTPTKAKRELIW